MQAAMHAWHAQLDNGTGAFVVAELGAGESSCCQASKRRRPPVEGADRGGSAARRRSAVEGLP